MSLSHSIIMDYECQVSSVSHTPSHLLRRCKPLSPVFHVAGILTSGSQFYPILCPVAVCKDVRAGGEVTLQGDRESRVSNSDFSTGDNTWLCNKSAQ